jgi:aspartate carbamoyltransferase catalytic subunit
MEEETILVELRHIKESINEIKARIERLESVTLKEIEQTNRLQDERMMRAEAAIKENSDSRKRIYDQLDELEKSLKDLREKPIKDKAEIINTVIKYAGTAVLGGVVAFVLSKIGILFQ